MICKIIVIQVAIISLSLCNLKGQSIAACVDKDLVTGSHLQFFVSWDCKAFSDKAAKDSLLSKGCKNISSIGYSTIPKGYFSVIANKTTNPQNPEKKIKYTYGFGVDTSAELSLKKAIRNLEANNWSWNKEYGYEIITQKYYETCKVTKSIPIEKKDETPVSLGLDKTKETNVNCFIKYDVKKGICGDLISTINVSANQKNDENPSNNKPTNFKRFIMSKGHSSFAIIEFTRFCGADNSKYSELTFVSAPNDEELKAKINKEFAQLLGPNNITNVTVSFSTIEEAPKTWIEKLKSEIRRSVTEDMLRENKVNNETRKVDVKWIGVRG